MSRVKRKAHKWMKQHHRLVCRRCGKTKPAATCSKAVWVPEPAGESSLLCGYFEHRRTMHVKRLWDQLRLSLAYQPGGEEALTHPHPPQWFVREWLGDPEENHAG